MRLISFLLARAILPRKDSVLGYALWVSTAGVALGIALVMLVLAVMAGFQTMLKDNYTRISSELVVLPAFSQKKKAGFQDRLDTVPGIQASAPFGFGQAMVFKPGGGKDARGGVTLEGVDLEMSRIVTPYEEVWIEEPLWNLQSQTKNWIWVGAQLAKRLKVEPGEKVSLLVARGTSKEVHTFVVTAITKFGIFEHDLRYATVSLESLRGLFGFSDREPMYKLKLRPGVHLEQVREDVYETMGDSITVKLWSDINRNVFMAVEHQKVSLFLMLQIIVALAAVNVMNLLMMTSQNRRRDVAILRAMGMRVRGIFLYFLGQGTIIGVVGIVCGLVLGFGACKAAEMFQPVLLSEEIYNVAKLPLQISWTDIILICVSAIVLCIVFSLPPAIRASLERPVQTLRNE